MGDEPKDLAGVLGGRGTRLSVPAVSADLIFFKKESLTISNICFIMTTSMHISKS